MGDRSTTSVRGLLVHDRRVALPWSTTFSAFTEAGPRPAQVEADDDRSELAPQITSAQSNDLVLHCLRGGNADRPAGAGIGYRLSSEGGADVRSWNPPTSPEAPHVVSYRTTKPHDRLSVAVSPVSQVVCVCSGSVAGTVPSADLEAHTWDPATRTWSTATVFAGNAGPLALIHYSPTDRLIVFRARVGNVSEAYYSEDDGASWSFYTAPIYDVQPALFSGATNDQRGVAAVDGFGNILLIWFDPSSGDLEQYASADGGATFEQVAAASAFLKTGAAGNVLDVHVLSDGSIGVAYIPNGGGSALYRTIGTAFDDLSAVSGSTITGSGGADVVSLWQDFDRVLYAAILEVANDRIQCRYSVDDGDTWTGFTDTTHDLWGAGIGASGKHPTNFQLRAAAGCQMLVCQGDDASTASDSIYAVELGGWSNLELDTREEEDVEHSNRGSYADSGGTNDADYIIPIDLPANLGYATAGAGTTALSADGWNVTTTSPASEIHSVTWTYTSEPLSVLAELDLQSGGSVSALNCGLEITRQDGTNEYIAEVRVGSSGFRLYDNHGAASLGDATGITTGDGFQLLVIFTAAATPSQVSTFYRAKGSSVWEVGPAGTLTNSANIGTTDQLRWGHVAGATSESNWRIVGYGNRNVYRKNVNNAGNFSRCRWGKAVPGQGVAYPVRDEGDDDARAGLWFAGGRGRYGETFRATAEHDYSADMVLPQVSPSPARPWRSTQKASAEELAIEVGGDYDTRLDHGWFWALAVVGVDLPRHIQLRERAAAAGSFSTLGTLDLAEGFASLTYDLHGDTIRPAAAGTTAGARPIREGEYAGGIAILDPDGSGAGPLPRRIKWNSAGVWDDTTGTAVCSLRLEGIDGTEDASEDVHLVHPGGVLLVPQTVAAANHTRTLQIRIPGGQEVPDSFYTIGVVCLGSVLVMGRAWSESWSLRWLPNVRQEQTDDGTTYTEERGAPYRELTVSWPDGADELRYQGPAEPDYVAAGSTRAPETLQDDVLWRLAGLLEASQSGELAVVALTDIPDSNAAVSLTDPALWLYGTLTGNVVQANNVRGAPGADAYSRIESLTITEQPLDRR